MHRYASFLAASALSLLTCAPGDGGGNGSSANPTVPAPSCDKMQPEDSVHFRVVYPNGGEQYHVGDTMFMEFCSSDDNDYTIGTANRALSIDGKKNWIALPPRVASGKYYWVVDSIYDVRVSAKVYPVSDQCYVQIAVYSQQGDPTVDNDANDRPFIILP